jgi:general secretion pathway protein A
MYLDYFGLKELPFSIAPDPRYLYMSERHREALAHLLYGVSGQGGFVVLTGEVGTGKTTICRCFLNQIPNNTDVAFIINPKLSARELMATICDELSIKYPDSASIKVLNDLINHYLLNAHANNRHTVLIIDEAQNLRVDVLEQLRLLTNLETSEKKLLQIILLGQPELRDLLAQKELRQLAQRVTARYHLNELNNMEVGAYVNCRLAVAGRKGRLFNQQAIKQLYKMSGGVPRLINLICDRALLGAYASQSDVVEPQHIKSAYLEIQGEKARKPLWQSKGVRITSYAFAGFLLFLSALFVFQLLRDQFSPSSDYVVQTPLADQVSGAAINLASDQVPADANQAVWADSSNTEQVESTLDKHTNNPASWSVKPSATHKNGAPFLDQITGLTPSEEDKFLAYQAVLKRWGVAYPREPFVLACDFAEMYGLRCLHNSGNWRSLLKLDRPTVMTLNNEFGQTLYFALLAIEGQDALVNFQGQVYWVSMDELDRYWLGEYALLWKLPPYKSRVVVPGQQTEEQWLTNSFARLGRDYASTDESLSLKVQRFQKNAGLVPDGIAGTMTLIHINKRLCLDCPKLLGGL